MDRIILFREIVPSEKIHQLEFQRFLLIVKGIFMYVVILEFHLEIYLQFQQSE